MPLPTLLSGIALATLGYGGGLANLASFGYGGDDAVYTSGTYYNITGKTIVPISRSSSGPMIIKNQGDDTYLGKYYVTVIAQENGRPLKDVQWTFYAENVADISGTVYSFKQHLNTTPANTDQFGNVTYSVQVPLASGLADLYDWTGTSGQHISLWAVGDGTHITHRIEVEYRVKD